MLSHWTIQRPRRYASFLLIVGAVLAMTSSALAASSGPIAASARAHALKSSQSVKLINAFRARSEESGTLVSPPPPGQPNRANGNTKYTTRLWGNDPFQEAVAVTQLVYPAEGPTGVETSYPDDRPAARNTVNT